MYKQETEIAILKLLYPQGSNYIHPHCGGQVTLRKYVFRGDSQTMRYIKISFKEVKLRWIPNHTSAECIYTV